MSQREKKSNEEDALENALSPIVNRLIDKNFENSGDKMASHIAPLIGGAIREQIKSQKNDIIDALYPVMGNMISKFVTKSLEDLLNKINHQIQNGLSVKAVKRKIKAKLKGVSESELLLEEHTQAKINAVLLIHKESGTLLCKVEDGSGKLSDADMLASMMSAIRSFVNEWIQNNEQDHELGEIEYGGNKIILEASGYSYLAVIVEGAAYRKTYEKIRSTLEEIILEYGEEIKNFQGSFENFSKTEITQELEKLLSYREKEAQEQEENKKHPLLLLLPSLFLLYILWYFYQSYRDEELLNEVNHLLKSKPALLLFNIEAHVKDNTITLDGNVPFSYHKELAQKQLEPLTKEYELHNNLKVIPTLNDPMQISADIAYLLKGVNLNPQTNINYTFDYNRVILNGYTANKKLKKQLLKEIKKIKGVHEVKEQIKVIEPKIEANLYFDKASTQLNQDALTKLILTLNTLKKVDQNFTVVLKAYSDMIGNKQTNRALAKKRIESIEKFLQENAKLNNPVKSYIFDTPPPGIDPKKEPKKARRITLRIEKDEK